MLTPIAVGFALGIGALGSYLVGTIATGLLMAVFLSNSGGAWDNSRSSSKTETSVERAHRPTKPLLSVTPLVTHSRTPLGRRSTR